MKKFIAILSILLLINSSCETEKISSNNKELEQVQLAFTDDFATLIPFDFAVNWSTAKKGFSEELDADVTEFDVFWTGNYNPEDLYIARKNKEELTKNYRVTYKIIAAKEKNSYNFYAVKFTTYEGIEIESLSFLALNLLNGNINVYNNDSEEIISKSYVKGNYI